MICTVTSWSELNVLWMVTSGHTRVVIFLALQEVCKLFRQALRLHMSSRLTNSEILLGSPQGAIHRGFRFGVGGRIATEVGFAPARVEVHPS